MILTLLLNIILLVMTPRVAPYWVSPSGVAAWGACQSNTDPGANYCSLDTANTNAVAGDTIYLKGTLGVYPMTSMASEGIVPHNRGTATNKITYANAPGENPVIESTCVGSPCGYWAIYIGENGLDAVTGTYIRITGITVHNVVVFAQLHNFANYNEIDHCNFYSDDGKYTWFGIMINGGCTGGAYAD
jgi:hypothetical protein